MRLCVLSRGRGNVWHNKKISLVSFRDIDRLVYRGAPADAIVLEVSQIVILSLFYHERI